MTKRKMFFKMITASLVRRRSRMLVALLAIAVGATILSGLVTIYIDVPRQMGAQFRNYGANMIFVSSGTDGKLEKSDVDDAVSYIETNDLVGVTPYRYETVRIHEQPVVVAGTDIEGAKVTSPYWHIEGDWPSNEKEVLVGKEMAQLLGLKIDDMINLTYYDNESETEEDLLNLGVDMKVKGILDTGGSEEDYIYMSMEDIKDVAGGEDEYDIVEVSISATQEKIEKYEKDISDNADGVSPRLVKRVTQSEGTVLTKLQALVFIVTAVVLILTMICVATTMNAVVAERRKEIGLRKALGASDGSIVREFMGEGMLLGGIGGIVGVILGFLFAQLVSINVFSSSITFRPLILPITIIVSIIVTGVACLIPVRSAVDIDPALVLKGE